MAELMQWTEFREMGQPQWRRKTAVQEIAEPGLLAQAEQTDPLRGEEVLDLTVAEFVACSFLPEHIVTKRTPGRRHYQAILKHILNPDYVDRIFGVDAQRSKTKLKVNPNWPYIDNVRLREIQPDHVRRLVSSALETGYSTQTAKHIRNVLSAVISHAVRVGYFVGDNPVISVPQPGMRRKELHTLTFEQTVTVLQAMRYPEFEISLIALLTGMNIAEICGLQWKHVNLTDHAVNREGELIPPRSIAVRKQSYRGEISNVSKSRRKNIPIPQLLRTVLLRLNNVKSAGWNDFVLMSRNGSPINQINIAARRLKTIGVKLSCPWLSWQVFRRTRVQLIQQFGERLENELAVAIMTLNEPQTPVEGRRQ